MDDYQRTIFAKMKLISHAKIYCNILAKEEMFDRNLMTWVKMKEMLKAKCYPGNHNKKLYERLTTLRQRSIHVV